MESGTVPDPQTILQTAFSFWSSKVLLSAVEMGVFTALGKGSLTGSDLGEQVGIHPRGVADFFDALVAMKMFEELYSDLPRLEQFMGAMTGISRFNFEVFAEKFDFSAFQTHCEVGGATGLLSIEIAKRHPHLRCTSFDLPPVEPIAKKSIAASGLEDRIHTAAGDFFQGPLPQADLITMGMILHDWNLEKKMHLIRAAYDALPEGGAFVVIEALIDDARRENLQGLLMSLNMLIEFGDAFDYSGADFREWCSEAGFKRFDTIPLAGPSSAAIAWK